MSSRPTSPASVPLLNRARSPLYSHTPPIWPLEASRTGEPLPTSANCARTTRDDGVCCRELKEEERTLIDPDIVRDVVIGLSDGLTVPFALTAGLSSLGESRFVVLAGLAELIAGAISMGIGGFLASQSERDHYRYLRHQTAARVLQSCDSEMERKVADILAPIGVDEKACRAVTRSLKEVEVGEQGKGPAHLNGDEESSGMKRRSDAGLTAFLLKFGSGLEAVPDRRLYISAFTIGMGYLFGGFVPLLPYFFIPNAQVALIYSVVITGVVLLIFGVIKAHVTGAGRGTYSYVWGAISTLLVGGIAAGAAFGLVKAVER